MSKVVISLSGGLDSTTLLAKMIKEGNEVVCVNFYYKSKHNDNEVIAVRRISHFYNVDTEYINLDFMGDLFKSNLLKKGDGIPHGHYAAPNMSLTVVPGRNSIFTTILAGFAESIGFDTVALGQHKGDHHCYPDCRPEFIESMAKTIELSSEGKVKVIAPFTDLNKIDICKIGLELKVPYELTWTCYDPQGEKSCGKCGSCNERLEAFNLNKSKDPLKYV